MAEVESFRYAPRLLHLRFFSFHFIRAVLAEYNQQTSADLQFSYYHILFASVSHISQSVAASYSWHINKAFLQ